MPAPSKLGEIWADVRHRWENDPREGYAWVPADMSLPITGAAVRNMAIRIGWSKSTQAQAQLKVVRVLSELEALARPRRPRGNHRHLEDSYGLGSKLSDISDDQRLLYGLYAVFSGT